MGMIYAAAVCHYLENRNRCRRVVRNRMGDGLSAPAGCAAWDRVAGVLTPGCSWSSPHARDSTERGRWLRPDPKVGECQRAADW